MQRITKAASLTLSGILIFFAAAWPLRADLIDGAMTAGRAIIPPVVSNLSYPVSLQDCFRPLVQVGTGTSGFLNITLPGASALPSGCVLTFKNGDIYAGANTGRGKNMAGPWPSDINTNVLWPQQQIQLVVANGAYQTTNNPGHWSITQQVTLCKDTGGLDTNDGLGSGASGCLLTFGKAVSIIQTQFDLNNTTPIVAPTCGQTHSDVFSIGGQPTGNNLVQISPNCSVGTVTWTNATACISIADNAEIDLRLNGTSIIAFVCNTSNALFGQIQLHNFAVLDLEGGPPQWNPAGANDNFLYCDGPCQFTIANGITDAVGTSGGYFVYMSAGGHGTASGALTGATSTLAGAFWGFGPGLLNLGISNGGGFTSIGTSKSYAGFHLILNGISVPGGTSAGTGTGRTCTSLTDSTC